MKAFLAVALVLGIWSAAVLADSNSTEAPLTSDEKEEKAFKECNVTNPVQRNPADVIVQGIVTGDVTHLTPEERCNLYCFLQKVRFFDENGDMRGTGLVNHTLREAPALAKYSDVIITQVFQIRRSTKGVQDKCLKALICFHQYLTNIFSLALADGLQTYTDVRGKIEKAVDEHTAIPSELETQVKEFLKLIDDVMRAIAKTPQSGPATATTSVPPQVKPPVV